MLVLSFLSIFSLFSTPKINHLFYFHHIFPLVVMFSNENLIYFHHFFFINDKFQKWILFIFIIVHTSTFYHWNRTYILSLLWINQFSVNGSEPYYFQRSTYINIISLKLNLFISSMCVNHRSITEIELIHIIDVRKSSFNHGNWTYSYHRCA